MFRKPLMDLGKLGPESGNFLRWYFMGGKEAIQCSLGQGVPLVPSTSSEQVSQQAHDPVPADTKAGRPQQSKLPHS